MIDAAQNLWKSAGSQLAGTFLAPGSTYSFAALACSLALFVAVALPAKRGRALRHTVLLRALFPRRLLRSVSGRTDLAWFVSGLLFSGVSIGWALFSADQLRSWMLGLFGPAPAPWLPGWASASVATVLLFLAYEFAYWLDHWLMHRVPALWAFHKIHHQAESLSLFTNGRVHPLETIGFYNLVALCMGVTGALLERTLGAGVTQWNVGGTNLLILLFAVCVTHLQHSHLWLTFGPWFGRLLLSPAHHQIHHSTDPRHFNRNLGSSLTLFDRLFGTLQMPETKREPLRFGVDDGATKPHGLHAALVAPWIGAWKAMRTRPAPLNRTPAIR
jgi:sterol desaturase/sphingolipid hydroxylase (fatty acid hydroxylase superfamily)